MKYLRRFNEANNIEDIKDILLELKDMIKDGIIPNIITITYKI